MRPIPSLQERLDGRRDVLLDSAPPGIRKALLDNIQTMRGLRMVDHAKRAGSRAPDFTLPNQHGELVSLSARLARGPVALVYYRGGWCPFCSLELEALEEVRGEVEALGASLIAVSPQTAEATAKTARDRRVSYDLLSDAGSLVTREYGLAYVVDEVMRPIYASFGINLAESNGDTRFLLPVPATYLIGADGVILHDFLDENYMRRMEPSEMLDRLRAMAGAR